MEILLINTTKSLRYPFIRHPYLLNLAQHTPIVLSHRRLMSNPTAIDCGLFPPTRFLFDQGKGKRHTMRRWKIHEGKHEAESLGEKDFDPCLIEKEDHGWERPQGRSTVKWPNSRGGASNTKGRRLLSFIGKRNCCLSVFGGWNEGNKGCLTRNFISINEQTLPLSYLCEKSRNLGLLNLFLNHLLTRRCW